MKNTPCGKCSNVLLRHLEAESRLARAAWTHERDETHVRIYQDHFLERGNLRRRPIKGVGWVGRICFDFLRRRAGRVFVGLVLVIEQFNAGRQRQFERSGISLEIGGGIDQAG